VQGSHTAMKSGMLAAEAVYEALTREGEEGTVAAKGGEQFDGLTSGAEVAAYETGVL
jgi:flavin-dependent dehydrogenase